MSLRLLAYSHDTVGLGHLRRTLGICGELTRSLPGLSALIVTGSPMAEGFRLPERTDYVKLPSVRKITNGAYEPRSLQLDFDSLASIRKGVLRKVAQAFRPDVLLVDKTPAGLKGELLPALEALRGPGSRCRIVLGLREILDDPETVREEWSREGLWEIVERCYDEVWIYGQRDIYDTAGEYGFPAAIARKTHFLGYLPRYNGLLPRGSVERKLGLGDRRLVVVTAGGGEDGYPLFDAYLEGLEGGSGPANTLHCLVCGPGMEASEQARLAARTDRPDVHFAHFSRNLTSFFSASSLIVTF